MRTRWVCLFLAISTSLAHADDGALDPNKILTLTNDPVLGKADRMILLMVACVIYAAAPDRRLYNLSIFEIMFVLFIPLASITLLQRLDKIFTSLQNNATPKE